MFPLFDYADFMIESLHYYDKRKHDKLEKEQDKLHEYVRRSMNCRMDKDELTTTCYIDNVQILSLRFRNHPECVSVLVN